LVIIFDIEIPPRFSRLFRAPVAVSAFVTLLIKAARYVIGNLKNGISAAPGSQGHLEVIDVIDRFI